MTTTAKVPTAPVHQPARTAPAHWFMGGRCEVRLSSEQTGGWLGVHEHRLPPGSATPLHVHPEDDESFIVLEGTVRFHLSGEDIDADEGDALHVPRETPHAFLVTSGTAARVLIIATPAGHERFFALAGEPAAGAGLPPAPQGPPDMGRMAAAAAECGFEILGPPPFGAPPGA